MIWHCRLPIHAKGDDQIYRINVLHVPHRRTATFPSIKSDEESIRLGSVTR